MISGSAALTASNNTTGSLSYINTIITDATASGSYFVVVPNRYINESMITTLKSVYGYKITPKSTDIGTNLEYVITWN
jgi:hypothetical protein